MESVTDLLLGILRGALLIVGAWWLGGWLRGLASRSLESRIDPSWRVILSQAVRFVPLLFVMQFVLEGIGFPSGTFLAVISTAGVAIALSLKDSLSNAASGAILLTTAPFRVGDTVTVGGTVNGVVRKIGFLTTELDTDDGRRITLTNDKVLAAPMERHAANGLVRIEVIVRVPRREVDARLLAALTEVADASGEAPSVVPTDLDDATARIVVRASVPAASAPAARAALFVALDARLSGE